MQTKLTLRLDDELIEEAKSYAARAGKSVSQIVADYFRLLTKGTTNIGVRNGSPTVFTPSTVQTVWNGAAETTAVAKSTVIMITATAIRTITNTPSIADGQDGQLLLIINTGANAITYQDQGTLAASNLRLGAATRALGTRDQLLLMYSATVGDWVEVVYSNVV